MKQCIIGWTFLQEERSVLALWRKKEKIIEEEIYFKGEGQRGDGRYYYQYKNGLNKPKVIYSWTLEELRKREKEIQKDLADSIDETAAKMSLNQLFELYLSLKDKENFLNSTRNDYLEIGRAHV